MALIVESLPAFMTGAVISFIMHITGIGGGVLLIPALTIIFKMDIPLAVGTAGLYLTLSKIFSVADHAMQKNIAYLSCVYFLIGAIPGIIIVGFGITYILSAAEPETIFTVKTWLEYFTVGVIFIAIGFSLNKRFNFIKSLSVEIPGNVLLKLSRLGMLVGGVMAASGVGGGILVIPILMKYTDFKMKIIIGSSVFIAMIISFVTFLVYAKGGVIDYRTAILMTIGSFLTIPIGGIIVRRISDRSVEDIVLVLIICSAFYMLFS